MTQVIKYYKVNVYGKDNLYIQNADTAKAWLRISGRVTITLKDMETLSKMFSIRFEEVLAPNKE